MNIITEQARKDRDNNPYYDSSIQKSLKKLISEEWFAGQMYKLFIDAVDPEEKTMIEGVMENTAEDELEDHLANLVKVARKFGYDVPATLAEFEKYANEEDCKAFETFKSRKDAETYLKLAIESEHRAIASYKEALQNKRLNVCPEVEYVFTNNYYDEVEHLNQFSFLYSTLGLDADVLRIDQGNKHI